MKATKTITNKWVTVTIEYESTGDEKEDAFILQQGLIMANGQLLDEQPCREINIKEVIL